MLFPIHPLWLCGLLSKVALPALPPFVLISRHSKRKINGFLSPLFCGHCHQSTEAFSMFSLWWWWPGSSSNSKCGVLKSIRGPPQPEPNGCVWIAAHLIAKDLTQTLRNCKPFIGIKQVFEARDHYAADKKVFLNEGLTDWGLIRKGWVGLHPINHLLHQGLLDGLITLPYTQILTVSWLSVYQLSVCVSTHIDVRQINMEITSYLFDSGSSVYLSIFCRCKTY